MTPLLELRGINKRFGPAHVLRGVDFFWPAQHLLSAVSLLAGMILAIFLVADLWCYRLEHPHIISHHKTQATIVRIRDQRLPARRHHRGDPAVGGLEAGDGH